MGPLLTFQCTGLILIYLAVQKSGQVLEFFGGSLVFEHRPGYDLAIKVVSFFKCLRKRTILLTFLEKVQSAISLTASGIFVEVVISRSVFCGFCFFETYAAEVEAVLGEGKLFGLTYAWNLVGKLCVEGKHRK